MIECFKCKQEVKPGEPTVYVTDLGFNVLGHMQCPEPTEYEAPPELQLLVIDLGDSCVVKTEKGQWDGGKLLCRGARTDSVKVFYEPFTVLRDAIDAKPVPRIEQGLNLQFVLVHACGSRSLTKDEYYAINTLAGKNIPLWEGGDWKELGGMQDTNEYGDWIDKRVFSAWRYTR